MLAKRAAKERVEFGGVTWGNIPFKTIAIIYEVRELDLIEDVERKFHNLVAEMKLW